MKKIKLDSFEQSIEDNAESFKPVFPEKKEEIHAILRTINKSRNINIRISEHDLERVKQKSAAAGLPYQSLISSVIHRYVTDKLVDEDDILRSIRLLRAE